MVVKTKEPPAIDYKAIATTTAEAQLRVDRARAKQVLLALGESITDLKKNPTCQAIVELLWLEHRITQIETHGDALWCRGCAAAGKDPVEFPGAHWMVFECLEHAEEMLARSAKSWERSLFA